MKLLHHPNFKVHHFNQIATPQFGTFAEFGFSIAVNNSIILAMINEYLKLFFTIMESDSIIVSRPTSFIGFRLQPYHSNFNKRIVEMPKLYFYDTGLAVALLGVENAEKLKLHPFRESLFENMVIIDFVVRARLRVAPGLQV